MKFKFSRYFFFFFICSVVVCVVVGGVDGVWFFDG